MSAVDQLLGRKQALIEQLENDAGPNEREKIWRLLAQIETALNLLDPRRRDRRGARSDFPGRSSP